MKIQTIWRTYSKGFKTWVRTHNLKLEGQEFVDKCYFKLKGFSLILMKDITTYSEKTIESTNDSKWWHQQYWNNFQKLNRKPRTSKNWQNIKNKCRSCQTSAATTEIQKVQPSKIQAPTDKKIKRLQQVKQTSRNLVQMPFNSLSLSIY